MLKIYSARERRVSSRWDTYTWVWQCRCLCELGMLPLYHRQPRQQRWRRLVGYPSQSQRDTYIWSDEQLSGLPSACSLYHHFNWLEETFSDDSASWYRKDLLLLWSSECCCLAPGFGRAVSGDGAPPRMGECCPELLRREAILYKSELNHPPDCLRGIPKSLGGWDLILQGSKKRESSRNSPDAGGGGVFLKVLPLHHGIELA